MGNRGKSDEIYVEIDALHWLGGDAEADCSHWCQLAQESRRESEPGEHAKHLAVVALGRN